jgi:hypothetical protein
MNTPSIIQQRSRRLPTLLAAAAAATLSAPLVLAAQTSPVNGSTITSSASPVSRGTLSVDALPSRAGAECNLPRGHEHADLDPMDFTTTIDNPYYPLRPGDRKVWRETSPDGTKQKIVDRVTHRTKLIANGVTARVVIAKVTDERGRPVERTEEWFAQDRVGCVWYFGEDTYKIEDGTINPEGSFEAGVNGAEPGVQMPARPKAGMKFRLEGGYLTGAADHTEILSVGQEQVEVPYGHFTHVVMNRDTTPLHRQAAELWFYAKGVGGVLAIDISDGDSREELVRFTRKQ